MSAAEQLLAENNVKIAELIKEAQRWRDASAGLNAVYPTVTEGRQSVADGKYFSVPGNGAYMRLYRRQGASAELIAEFPDRNELNSVIDQLGPLLGRGVTGGLNNLGNGGGLVRLDDAVFAARANFGLYHSAGSANRNIDKAPAGECALYSTSNMGVFPENSGAFVWVETQRLYSNNALFQCAVNYANTTNPHSTDLKVRSWKRISSGNTTSEGERIWGDWVEDITTQNIVGNVDQSSVIESGSNADGDYLKLAGGTMICRTRVLFNYGVSSWQTFSTPLAFALGNFGISWSFTSSSHEFYTKWKAVAFCSLGNSKVRGIYRTEGTTLELEDVSEYLDLTMVGRWKA